MTSWFYKADPSLPIQVQFDKLLDMLVGQGIVADGWRELHSQLCSTCESLQKDPVSMNYFDIVNMVEEMEEKDGGAVKDWWGRYLNNETKAWATLKRDFETKAVHIASISMLLCDNLVIKVPMLRAKVATLQKELVDISRKISSYEDTILQHDRKFQHTCDILGIAGDIISIELQHMAHLELPVYLKTVLGTIQNARLVEIVDYYKTFLSFTFHSLGEEESSEYLETLTDILGRHFNGDDIDVQGASLDPVCSIEAIEIGSEMSSEINWGVEDAEQAEIVQAVAGNSFVEFILVQSQFDSLQCDILELLSFLQARDMELGESEKGSRHGVPSEQTSESINTWIHLVQDVFDQLSSDTLTRLLIIHRGGATFKGLVDGLNTQKNLSHKLRVNICKLRTREGVLCRENEVAFQNIDNQLSNCNTWKPKLEKCIQEAWREVKIVGIPNVL